MLLPHWLEDDAGLHRVAFDLALAWAGTIREVGSPSHRIRVSHGGEGEARVTLGSGPDVPNRDLVLDVRGETAAVRVYGGGIDSHEGRFSVVVPSSCLRASSGVSSRHVIFLLDRSGSMEGAALTQAKQALTACLGALEPQDRFNLLGFDDHVECFRDASVAAEARERKAAEAFLDAVQARGGTELGPALEQAIRWAKDAGGGVSGATRRGRRLPGQRRFPPLEDGGGPGDPGGGREHDPGGAIPSSRSTPRGLCSSRAGSGDLSGSARVDRAPAAMGGGPGTRL